MGFWKMLRPGTLGIAALLVVSLAPSLRADDAKNEQQDKEDAKIARLIAELGADEYETRERAQRQLKDLAQNKTDGALRLKAFDALYDAQHHDDIEIAMRARYLVRAFPIDLWQDGDPDDVKVIMRNFGDQNDAERKSRMERLAGLEDHQGIGALCRLARFEQSNILSKRAALLVLTTPEPETAAARTRLSRQIKEQVGTSNRPSADWLRAYAITLVDPDSAVSLWDRLAQAERDVAAQRPDDRFSHEIVRDLMRWQAAMLHRIGREEASLVVMRRSVDMIDGSREQLIDAVDWLIQREAWSVVEHVASRFDDQFESNAFLLYRLAEAQARQGQMQLSESTADRALALHRDDPDVHIVTAVELQECGLMDWAEREYRHVMELGPTGSLPDLRARMLLSEMLHDIGIEFAAAKVLQGAVDAIENDPNVQDLVEKRLWRPVGSVYSRMHYFYAQHYAADGNKEKEKVIEHLTAGVKNDPTDADVLIAMYRVPEPDNAWRQFTKQKIDAAVGHFRTQIREFREAANEAPSEALKSWANRQLASADNQLAWLVGNTEGDFDEAVRCSHESLELRPDEGGYLDTLGRCYFAKGDYASAVKYQRRAVELEPYSGQIKRQLELFEKTLAEKQKQ